MSKAKFYSFASVISEIKQSDMFMTVKARMLETPKANLNGARVTEAFVDEVISNEERYVGLPLYADTRALLSGRYNSLGHLYNSKTGEFHSTQIGSFYQFEKEEFEGGAFLVGYARIPKRNKQLSKAIAELFADGSLKFSFEIACGDWEELDDGTIEIDASESNYLEGMAIVSFPACEEAVALEFVAQREADDPERGVNEMAEVEKLETEQVVAEETEATKLPEQAEVQPEQVTAEEKVEETAEKETEETAKETAETEEASCKKKEDAEEKTEDASCKKEEKAEEAESETAAVYVRESTRVTETVDAYDTETGTSAFQQVEVTTGKSQEVEGNLVETDSGLAIAEGENTDAPAGDTPAESTETSETQGQESGDTGNDESATEQETASDAADEDVPRTENDKKKTAEAEEIHETAEELIASLAKKVEALAEEIRSLKEQRVTAAEEKVNVTAAAINPFVDSITTKGSYYDLLQPAEKKNGRDLLSK